MNDHPKQALATRESAMQVPDGHRCSFSVVIPCLNGEATLERQLMALVSQSYSGSFEVIVADNGSTDRTAEIVDSLAAQFPVIQRVDASRTKGINHARNRGVEESSGEFIVFCDADDEVDVDWLEEIAKVVAGGAVAVGGTLDRRLPSGERLSLEQRLYKMFWDIPWPAGANCGFARSIYDEVGPFDEELVGGSDETDYFWRIHFAGYSTELVASAVVKYFVRQDLGQVFRQAKNYGASQVRLYVKYRAKGMPRSKPWRAVAVLLISSLGVVFSPPRSPYRRKAVERLGAHVGRVRGSFREGVFYL